METRTILAAIFIAVAYSTRPIIGKYLQASGGWLATLVMIGTAGAVFLLSLNDITGTPLPTGKALLLLAIAAVINGVAVWLYSEVSVQKEVPTGMFIAVVYILGVMIGPLIDTFVNNEQITPRNMAGMGLATIAIYLLSK